MHSFNLLPASSTITTHANINKHTLGHSVLGLVLGLVDEWKMKSEDAIWSVKREPKTLDEAKIWFKICKNMSLFCEIICVTYNHNILC